MAKSKGKYDYKVVIKYFHLGKWRDVSIYDCNSSGKPLEKTTTLKGEVSRYDYDMEFYRENNIPVASRLRQIRLT